MEWNLNEIKEQVEALDGLNSQEKYLNMDGALRSFYDAVMEEVTDGVAQGGYELEVSTQMGRGGISLWKDVEDPELGEGSIPIYEGIDFEDETEAFLETLSTNLEYSNDPDQILDNVVEYFVDKYLDLAMEYDEGSEEDWA